MKLGSTHILRATIIVIGLIIFALCVFVLPRLIMAEFTGDFDYGWIFVGMYLPAIPFFFGLYQTLMLLRFIDKKTTFSQQSVKALANIKHCAYIISAIYAAGMPYIFYVADRDDAPGVAAIGFVIIGASFVVGTAAAVFQGLLQNAVEIKSENDMTV